VAWTRSDELWQFEKDKLKFINAICFIIVFGGLSSLRVAIYHFSNWLIVRGPNEFVFFILTLRIKSMIQTTLMMPCLSVSLFFFFFFFYYFFIGVTSQNAIEKWVMNFQTSQIGVSKFLNVSIKGNLLGFVVKYCQNFQNTHISFWKKKIKIVRI
jgi:hypothetical protein